MSAAFIYGPNAWSSGTPARRAATIPATPLLRAALSNSERFAADIAASGWCRNSPSFRASVARIDKNSLRLIALLCLFAPVALVLPFTFLVIAFPFTSLLLVPFAREADFLTTLLRDRGILSGTIDWGVRHWNLSNLKSHLS